MEALHIKFKKLSPDAVIPKRKSSRAVGLDLTMINSRVGIVHDVMYFNVSIR